MYFFSYGLIKSTTLVDLDKLHKKNINKNQTRNKILIVISQETRSIPSTVLDENCAKNPTRPVALAPSSKR